MKVALITGGSRGIGAATVRLFAQKGYSVILNYNQSEQAAFALRDELRQNGFDVHAYQADVSDVAQVAEMFAWVKKFFKHLDVLVNNAGVCYYSPCLDVNERVFDKTFNVNCKGTFFCCKHAVDLLRRSQHGNIVNVSSIWGRVGASCESVYCMTKHAVLGLTKSLADELNGEVRVNCVCPSIVRTDMCRNLSEEDVAAFCEENNVCEQSPLDVAQLILQLAETDATGVIM